MICLSLVSISILTGLVFLIVQLRLLRVDAMRDYGEGHTLWMAQQMTNPALAYKPLDGLPYVIFPYPPLYLMVSKIVGLLTGNLLLAGRSVSLISTFGLAAVIAVLVAQSVPRSFPLLWRLSSGMLASALVLSTASVVGWASLMRVDMLGMMLMYGGLAVYILSGSRKSGQYLAVFLFVMAAFAKQTLLSAPVACAIFGLIVDPKTTIRVYGFALLLGAVGLAVCNWITDGGFLKNILSYNLNPFSWEVVFAQFSSHLRLNVMMKLLLSGAALISVWKRERISRSGWRRFISTKASQSYPRAILIGSLNGLFAGLLAISIGKMGSVYNFFLAWDVSLCLLTGLYLFRLLATWHTRSRQKAGYSILVLSIIILLFIPGRWLVSTVTEDFDGKINEEKQLVKLIQGTPGPVLSDNMLAVVKAGRKIEAETATLAFLTMAGGWNETPYADLFDNRYFSLIVTTPLRDAGRYSHAVILSIEKNYQVHEKVGEYLIYRPRKSER